MNIKNLNTCEKIIQDCITKSIRSQLPVKHILQEYLVEIIKKILMIAKIVIQMKVSRIFYKGKDKGKLKDLGEKEDLDKKDDKDKDVNENDEDVDEDDGEENVDKDVKNNKEDEDEDGEDKDDDDEDGEDKDDVDKVELEKDSKEVSVTPENSSVEKSDTMDEEVMK